MNVRSLHLADDGTLDHVDVRLTADEARALVAILGNMQAALASALTGQRSEPIQPPALQPIQMRRLRRLTDSELAAVIDEILERDPLAGRDKVRQILADRGFMGGNQGHLAHILKARKRARYRTLALPIAGGQ